MSGGLQQYLDSLVARLPLEDQRRLIAQDERNAKLAEQLRQHCADAMIQLGEAMKCPNISRAALEEAHTSVAKALSIASAIDPEYE